MGDADLATECQAFLAGEYADYLSARSLPIPAWAWMNRLAHGDLDDVRALAAARPGQDPLSVVAGLAREVLRRMESRQVDLVTIQSQSLIPLERRLAAAGDVLPRDAGELSTAIKAAATGGIRPWDQEYWA